MAGTRAGPGLTSAASLLVAAALFVMWGARGGWLAAGAAGLAVVGGMFHGWEYLLPDPGSAVSALVIMVLVGALARGVTGAAWSVAAVGALHVIAPVAGGLMVYPAGTASDYLLITGPLGLLSAAMAVVVIAVIRGSRDLVAR